MFRDSSLRALVRGKRQKEAAAKAGEPRWDQSVRALKSGEPRKVLQQGLGPGTLTSIVINTVRLYESYGDRPAQRVILLLQLCLPQDGVPILAEVFLGPVTSGELTGAVLLAEDCHSIQAIVAHVVAGDMGQAR